MTWLAVAIGGAIGSMARHGVNQLVSRRLLTTTLPLGTMIVNLVGCFVIGVLVGLIASDRLAMRANWREFVFVGLLGGFTTFSAFGLDTFTLARGGLQGQAILNVAVHVLGGLAAVWIGYQLSGVAS